MVHWRMPFAISLATLFIGRENGNIRKKTNNSLYQQYSPVISKCYTTKLQKTPFSFHPGEFSSKPQKNAADNTIAILESVKHASEPGVAMIVQAGLRSKGMFSPSGTVQDAIPP